MKYLSAILGLSLLVVTARAALPQPDLLAQIHFAGAQKISADPHAVAFTNEFCSTEALMLRSQTANKLAAWLPGWLQTNLSVVVPAGSEKLRPLFDDLQSSEWFLEARAAGAKPEVAIAIKLDSTRAQLWQAALKPFFITATFKSVAGGWLIFDSNPTLLGLGDHLAQKVVAPPAGWLDLDVNWPRLGQWYPVLKDLALPETHFNLTAPDDNFRINGKCYFPESLALNLEPWHVPTNALHAPFNSFTAVRGFASWFQSQKWAQPYQITPVPNELFVWSLPYSPFRMFAAVPVPDAANGLAQLYSRLAPVIAEANARHDFTFPVTEEISNGTALFNGVPIIAPRLKPLSEPNGQFLFWETFPNSVHSLPLPPQLFQRLATKDLVFFHWEITAERIPQLLQLSQFGLMETMHKQLTTNSAGLQWIRRVGGPLGSTDTEITQSGPAELTFTRKAPGIFTAAEFFALANWLEATNFPGCDLRLPHRFPRLAHPHAQAFPLTTPVPGH
jgi:hypothetical protein